MGGVSAIWWVHAAPTPNVRWERLCKRRTVHGTQERNAWRLRGTDFSLWHDITFRSVELAGFLWAPQVFLSEHFSKIVIAILFVFFPLSARLIMQWKLFFICHHTMMIVFYSWPAGGQQVNAEQVVLAAEKCRCGVPSAEITVPPQRFTAVGQVASCTNTAVGED